MTVLVGRRASFNAAHQLRDRPWERLQPELPAGLLRSMRVWETDKDWAEVGDQA